MGTSLHRNNVGELWELYKTLSKYINSQVLKLIKNNCWQFLHWYKVSHCLITKHPSMSYLPSELKALAGFLLEQLGQNQQAWSQTWGRVSNSCPCYVNNPSAPWYPVFQSMSQADCPCSEDTLLSHKTPLERRVGRWVVIPQAEE